MDYLRLGVFMASEMAEPKTEPILFGSVQFAFLKFSNFLNRTELKFGSVWFYVKKFSIDQDNRNNQFFYFNFSKYLLKIYTNLI